MAIKKTYHKRPSLNGEYPESIRKIPGYSIAGEETRISKWLKAKAADCMKNVKFIPNKK